MVINNHPQRQHRPAGAHPARRRRPRRPRTPGVLVEKHLQLRRRGKQHPPLTTPITQRLMLKMRQPLRPLPLRGRRGNHNDLQIRRTMKRRQLTQHRPHQRAALLHLAHDPKTRETLQPNRFRNTLNVLLGVKELTQRMPSRRLKIGGTRDLGQLQRHRQLHLAHTHAHHRKHLTTRLAVPHPRRPRHTHQIHGIPMEMAAMLPLLTSLHINHVPLIVKIGKPLAPPRSQLTPRHLARRPTVAHHQPDRAKRSHPTEKPESTRKLTRPRGIHHHNQTDHAHNQRHRQHNPPNTARRRHRRHNRRIQLHLPATGLRRPNGLTRTDETMRRHQTTLTPPPRRYPR